MNRGTDGKAIEDLRLMVKHMEEKLNEEAGVETPADEAPAEERTIVMTDADTDEEVEAYVIEETELSGRHYLLVTTEDPNGNPAGSEEDGEAGALILREIREEDSSVLYETVTDDDELTVLGKLFSELLEDTEVSLLE